MTYEDWPPAIDPRQLGNDKGRVAVGRYRPTAPTDPYVRTLPHTVHQIMASLRERKLNVKCERAPAGIAGADDETSAKSSFADGCGD